MNSRTTLLVAALLALLPGARSFAQADAVSDAATAEPAPAPTDTVAEDAAAEDAAPDVAAADERLDLLDQTVPVADDVTGPPEADDAPELTDREQMMAEFERFKSLEAAGVFDQAENVAKRVVEMSIQLNGPRSNDTARALNNLGLIQHRMRNYEAAQQNFQSAIDILTENEDKLSRMLINPLKGLGASQLEGGRPDLAADTYGQAVHISHVNEGPHNLEQIEILEALAETNLRLGQLQEARDNQDSIYALSLRHFSGSAMDMVPSLLRRAAWQRRTGYILDERATHRRIIRIIESEKGKDDVALIEPLTRLGQSYFYVDTSESTSYQSSSVASGEMYFKRAVRIAEEHPNSDWVTLADSKLALADYYNFRGDQGRARKTYADVWELLSADEERLGKRREELERLTALNADPISQYIAGATRNDLLTGSTDLREGRIVVGYDVSSRGRVSSLKIVEVDPEDFDDMRRYVVRELRTRIYRPRFEDGEAVDTPNQVFTHSFYYLQGELDKIREQSEPSPDG